MKKFYVFILKYILYIKRVFTWMMIIFITAIIVISLVLESAISEFGYLEIMDWNLKWVGYELVLLILSGFLSFGRMLLNIVERRKEAEKQKEEP